MSLFDFSSRVVREYFLLEHPGSFSSDSLSSIYSSPMLSFFDMYLASKNATYASLKYYFSLALDLGKKRLGIVGISKMTYFSSHCLMW
jgi:hypothetical protein